jgi:hypothetical protein
VQPNEMELKLKPVQPRQVWLSLSIKSKNGTSVISKHLAHVIMCLSMDNKLIAIRAKYIIFYNVS